MKKILVVLIAISMMVVIATAVLGVKPDDCVKIQDGTLTYPTGHYLDGEPLIVGYDIFAHWWRWGELNSRPEAVLKTLLPNIFCLNF